MSACHLTCMLPGNKRHGVRGQRTGSGCLTFGKGSAHCSSRETHRDILGSKGVRVSIYAMLGRDFAAGGAQAQMSDAQAALLALGRRTILPLSAVSGHLET